MRQKYALRFGDTLAVISNDLLDAMIDVDIDKSIYKKQPHRKCFDAAVANYHIWNRTPSKFISHTDYSPYNTHSKIARFIQDDLHRCSVKNITLLDVRNIKNNEMAICLTWPKFPVGAYGHAFNVFRMPDDDYLHVLNWSTDHSYFMIPLTDHLIHCIFLTEFCNDSVLLLSYDGILRNYTVTI